MTPRSTARGARGPAQAPAALAVLAFVVAGCAGAAPLRAEDVGASTPLVVIDPGHGPDQPGATSVRGTPEVDYDDAFAAVLAPRLRRAGFRVALTRAPGEALDLEGRAARGDGAWLLLSIHHDSAQPRYLAREERDGRPAYRATRPLRGWALFVSRRNARYASSRRFAEALGRRLVALGRPPTLHHAEPIPGEGRPLLDPRLGLYRFDALAVLGHARCPAVLLEVGVLVDEADEAYVSDPERRAAIADAVVQALLDVRREDGGARLP